MGPKTPITINHSNQSRHVVILTSVAVSLLLLLLLLLLLGSQLSSHLLLGLGWARQQGGLDVGAALGGLIQGLPHHWRSHLSDGGQLQGGSSDSK